MIIVMKQGASQDQIDQIAAKIKELGYTPHLISGVERTVIGAVGDEDKERLKALITLPGVDDVLPVRQPYKLASRTVKNEDTIININGVQVGGGTFVVIAGPCSVETEDQILTSARGVKKAGAQFLRGGAYKPRTSPYSFQGLEEEGLKLLKKAKDETGLGIVTEIISPSNVDLLNQYADVIQVGARNMQNFALLREIGKLRKPILLKRGMSATIEELLMSAEYILSEGNYNVMLCERGIRTFEKAYRNTLDLNAVPALKSRTHLPVIVDPSHGTGIRDMVLPMSKAAIAAGADGLAIEVHPQPELAYSDGQQSLTIAEFERLMTEIKPFVQAAGKTLVVMR